MNSASDRIYDRAIGGLSGGASWASPGDDLKAKLQSKARRYGRPDRAFIVAVADFRMIAAEPDEICEALYGQWTTVVKRSTHTTSRRFLANGFFGHAARAQNTAVSAVLVVPGDPYWAAYRGNDRAVLYLNPFATIHLPAGSLPFSVTNLEEDGRLVESIGPTLQDLLLQEPLSPPGQGAALSMP